MRQLYYVLKWLDLPTVGWIMACSWATKQVDAAEPVQLLGYDLHCMVVGALAITMLRPWVVIAWEALAETLFKSWSFERRVSK